MILGAWLAGGLLALVGAFIYAELSNRMPKVGGQYAYIREAYDPLLGFLYGWVSILVINAGGTAAVAVTFGKYFREFSRGTVPENVAAVSVVAALTANKLHGGTGGKRRAKFFYGAADSGHRDDCVLRRMVSFSIAGSASSKLASGT
jgi:APA family basic amino acid/polyamine antiporter